MTDTVAIQTPAGPAPVPPAPDPAAEVETAPPDQAALEGEAPTAAPEIAYSNGSTSELVVDHFIDTEGDQSMNQIKAALPHIDPNTIESAVRRLWEKGRLLRISPGVYRLAPEKPPEPAKPASPPEPVRGDEMSDEEWLAALEAYFQNTTNWNPERFGPPPDVRPNRIPPHVALRFNDRLRKREERRKDREAAAARQAAADDALRSRLIEVCRGNFQPGPGINDLTVVRAMLADGVPLEHILIGLKRTVDRRIEPQAAPIASWREPRFLEAVAKSVLLGVMLPATVKAWSSATAPAKASPAVQLPPSRKTHRCRLQSKSSLCSSEWKDERRDGARGANRDLA